MDDDGSAREALLLFDFRRAFPAKCAVERTLHPTRQWPHISSALPASIRAASLRIRSAPALTVIRRRAIIEFVLSSQDGLRLTIEMTSHAATQSSMPESRVSSVTLWNSVAAYLVRRRVRITLAIFVLLVLEDVLIGVRPHEVFNVRDPEAAFGVALVVVGIAIRSWAAGVLHKTWELTTTGPYAVIRNPLYVGSFCIMCGFATLIDDVENIFVILGPLAGLYYLQVLHEERTLSQKYESRWQAYASEVPRFFPTRIPRTGALFSTWSIRDWLGSREYRAMGATLLGMVALVIWRRW